ncbi:MAG: hypothetical protein OHK0038_02960 [Flammeovirgaceae bacterium]
MKKENTLKNDEKSAEKVEKVMSENLQDKMEQSKTLRNEDKSNVNLTEESEDLTIPDFKKLLGCG